MQSGLAATSDRVGKNQFSFQVGEQDEGREFRNRFECEEYGYFPWNWYENRGRIKLYVLTTCCWVFENCLPRKGHPSLLALLGDRTPYALLSKECKKQQLQEMPIMA